MSDFVASAPATSPASGTILRNVSERDAAMIMAIVASEMKTPLNELRFKSIKGANRKFRVTLNGKTYEVEVERGTAIQNNEYVTSQPDPIEASNTASAADVVTASAPAAAASAPAPVSGEVITAPLPGNIVAVKVIVNQTVKKGDVLLVIEAMKMENEILAARDATVVQILANIGTTVETGAPLIVLG